MLDLPSLSIEDLKTLLTNICSQICFWPALGIIIILGLINFRNTLSVKIESDEID